MSGGLGVVGSGFCIVFWDIASCIITYTRGNGPRPLEVAIAGFPAGEKAKPVILLTTIPFRESSFVPLGFVPLGFGSLNHGIWPSIRVFGTQNLGVQTLRVQT